LMASGVGYLYVGPWLAGLVQKYAPAVQAGELIALICGVVLAVVVGWFVGKPLNWALGWVFRGFHQAFNWSTGLYAKAVGVLLRVSLLVLLVYGGLLGLTYLVFMRTPVGFIPQQDKGYLLVNVQLPDSAALERTEKIMRKLEGIASQSPGVQHT